MNGCKLIGLIGGMSWVSTADYYARLNSKFQETFGGRNSLPLLLRSINLEEYISNSETSANEANYAILSDAANCLHKGGAECVALCANTPHFHAERLRSELRIPLIHIAEATAKEVTIRGIHKVGILGTKWVMEEPFYTKALAQVGIESIVPSQKDRDEIHNSILREMTKNIFTVETRLQHLKVIQALKNDGAEAVVMACTEIPLLLKGTITAIPVLDTTELHCKVLFDFAMGGSTSDSH